MTNDERISNDPNNQSLFFVIFVSYEEGDKDTEIFIPVFVLIFFTKDNEDKRQRNFGSAGGFAPPIRLA